VLFVSCVSVSGALFSVGVCVCDLLIFLPLPRRADDARANSTVDHIQGEYPTC